MHAINQLHWSWPVSWCCLWFEVIVERSIERECRQIQEVNCNRSSLQKSISRNEIWTKCNQQATDKRKHWQAETLDIDSSFPANCFFIWTGTRASNYKIISYAISHTISLFSIFYRETVQTGDSEGVGSGCSGFLKIWVQAWVSESLTPATWSQTWSQTRTTGRQLGVDTDRAATGAGQFVLSRKNWRSQR